MENRIYKFRAWDKIGKQMLGDKICKKRLEEIPKTWELMQYTGLKSKSGKEIYFGDVVEAVGKSLGENHPAYDEIRGAGKQKLYCECDPHYLRIRFTQKPNGLFEFNSHELEEIEVIGNVHEHPHLLKT